MLLLSAPIAGSAENLPKILPEGVPALDEDSLARLHAATRRLYEGRSIQPKHASTSPEHMQNYSMTWCKTASGDWKIAENARPQ